MADLPDKKYCVIYADPPWTFKTRSAKGLTGRPQHYDRMTIEEIKALPIQNCADKDCWLFLWTTGPHLDQAFEVIKSWGFKYSGMGFVWIKLRSKAGTLFFMMADLFMGGGYTTRKNAEFCLLARRGKPKRLRNDIHEVMISPRREHSRKPDEFYNRIVSFAKGPYLELFSRSSQEGWDLWGNEVGKFGGTNE